jgi:hypothetical protein
MGRRRQLRGRISTGQILFVERAQPKNARVNPPPPKKK